ncbi:transporter [Thalassotalea sp. HSM 43]|uniref:transporter n=1 Tax=Thalassotalea sp. HSM 43 TaxID=2552945 RepID=UPI00107FD4C2|nr:transporter [Thalassotalea sp. HSM 43]QBY03898.1 transporter [Thalassotalea sp. HSM 43]
MCRRFWLLPLLAVSQQSFAKELDPRSYINIPIDQNFIGALYIKTKGDVYTTPDVPVEDLTLDIDGPGVAYAYTFSMFGNASKFDIAGGQACADGEAIYLGDRVERRYCGMTDTFMRLNYNFYGAKAMELSEFVKQPKTMVIGASLQVGIPTGAYDKQYVLNIGSNRWFFKPEIGMSIPFGNWEFDAAVSAKFFTNNTELLYDQTFEQDPVYNIQSHLIYDFQPGHWISFNANYYFGGDTYVDGDKRADKTGNFRGGITYSYAINSQHSVKFIANKGITTKRGNDVDVVAVAWAYRWQ